MNPVLFLLVGTFLGGLWPRHVPPVPTASCQWMTIASHVLIPVEVSGLSSEESSCEKWAAAATPLPSTSRPIKISRLAIWKIQSPLQWKILGHPLNSSSSSWWNSSLPSLLPLSLVCMFHKLLPILVLWQKRREKVKLTNSVPTTTPHEDVVSVS